MLFIFHSSHLGIHPIHPLDALVLGQSLDTGNSLLQKLLPERRLDDFGINGRLDGLYERGLFGFPLGLFKSDPRVEDGLEFRLDGGFLGEGKVGVFERGGFLRASERAKRSEAGKERKQRGRDEQAARQRERKSENNETETTDKEPTGSARSPITSFVHSPWQQRTSSGSRERPLSTDRPSRFAQ